MESCVHCSVVKAHKQTNIKPSVVPGTRFESSGTCCACGQFSDYKKGYWASSQSGITFCFSRTGGSLLAFLMFVFTAYSKVL